MEKPCVEKRKERKREEERERESSRLVRRISVDSGGKTFPKPFKISRLQDPKEK